VATFFRPPPFSSKKVPDKNSAECLGLGLKGLICTIDRQWRGKNKKSLFFLLLIIIIILF
jgi:hypothetical protein